MSNPIQVLIIEDSVTFREALEDVIKTHPKMTLHGSYGMTERALRFTKKAATQPDIILLDLQLPGISGLESIPQLLKQSPDAKIIVLTQSELQEDFLRAMESGISSYLLKSTSSKQVLNAILTTHQGNTIIDQSSTAVLINKLRTIQVNYEDPTLTNRELQVIELLAKGLSKKQISSKLGISTTTIVSHTISIYQKLDATNAPSAIANAYAQGVLKV